MVEAAKVVDTEGNEVNFDDDEADESAETVEAPAVEAPAVEAEAEAEEKTEA